MAGAPDTSAATSDVAIPGAGTPTPTAVVADAAPAIVRSALTDAQILEITHTANLGEIEQAKLAQSRARDPRVKALAAMMLKDHTAADAEGMALAAKAGFSAAESSTSTTLQNAGDRVADELRSKTGADFDRAYVDDQVKEHQTVLSTIDDQLIPVARSAGLTSYLAAVRAKVAMHLQHAQELQSELGK